MTGRRFISGKFSIEGVDPDDTNGFICKYGSTYAIWISSKYDKDKDSWVLLMSYSSPTGIAASPSELRGFQREAGFSTLIPAEEYAPHCFSQVMPEKPLARFKKKISPELLEKLLKNQAECEAFLSLDPDQIRKVLMVPEGFVDPDMFLLIARKKIAVMPVAPGSIRVESVRWLHENGYMISTFDVPYQI